MERFGHLIRTSWINSRGADPKRPASFEGYSELSFESCTCADKLPEINAITAAATVFAQQSFA
jgi:hypothetical protein